MRSHPFYASYHCTGSRGERNIISSPDLATIVFFLWDNLRGLIYETAIQIEWYLVPEFQQHVHLFRTHQDL